MMANAQINPRLIQLLLNKSASEVPTQPTRSMLPGKYVRIVNKNKDLMSKYYESNHQMLTCKKCGRKGKYDIGSVFLDIEKSQKNDPDDLQIHTDTF